MRRQAIILSLTLLGAIGSGGAQAADAPDVLVSIKPIHSLVAAVMEGTGSPELLIGGALSEHSYEMKPSDARKISRARVLFWIGPNLETYLTNPLRVLAAKAVVVPLASAAGIKILPARRGGIWGAGDGDDGPTGAADPHLWLDPQNAIAMTRAIAATLGKADARHAALYRANATREITTLQKLDAELRGRLKPLHGKPYLVFHDAYHYFEARYDLTPAGAVTVAPDRPVSPRRVAELHNAVTSGHATCIFREPQFPPRLIDTIADGTKVKTGVLDPLGADLAPGPSLYPKLLKNLADALSNCLMKR